MALLCRRHGRLLLLHFLFVLFACPFVDQFWNQWAIYLLMTGCATVYRMCVKDCMWRVCWEELCEVLLTTLTHALNCMPALLMLARNLVQHERRLSWRRSGLITLALAWMLLSSQVSWCLAGGPTSSDRLVYGRSVLLSFQSYGGPLLPNLLSDVPRELIRHHQAQPRRDGKARKRGRRGGIRHRVRTATKLPLPPMLLCNPRSLRSKMDDLRSQVGANYVYRESGLMAFIETWFSDDILDSFIQIDGFTHIRSDRNTDSGKTRGGGVCIYVKDSWCRNFAVRNKICNPDLELLLVTLRPHYLPREFTNIFVCVVYIPPSGNATRAANQISDCVHHHLQSKPDAPLFILGDFNHCILDKCLPGFYQYVKCNTRNNNILDKCSGNVKGAYTARARPPLSNSDHNTIQLLPTYRSLFKSNKPELRTVKVWSVSCVQIGTFSLRMLI